MLNKLLTLLVVCVCLSVHAQDVPIKGSVIDVNNEPLLGVNVKVKGGTQGTITDVNGKIGRAHV